MQWWTRCSNSKIKLCSTRYSFSRETRLTKSSPCLKDDTYHHGVLQGNFAPVDEVGEALQLSVTDGEIPDDFPQGIYLRTGD
ncbi:hypothetical protein B296_00013406 [Ensete ventricosum]|uniref:Uncharacterized protein n=1 Tax=Ensete ventricosum TaxID=4639 RepID=A0A427B8G2_ENSVE|nr:hypothetical protein B296_00013406 [Ensete ventricosum]